MDQTNTTVRRLRTVKQMAELNPAFTVGSLRWLLFNRETNGLNSAVVKVGHRRLIDEDAFSLWLDQHRERRTA